MLGNEKKDESKLAVAESKTDTAEESKKSNSSAQLINSSDDSSDTKESSEESKEEEPKQLSTMDVLTNGAIITVKN